MSVKSTFFNDYHIAPITTYLDVNVLLPALIHAVNEAYPTDKTRPSVITAYIEDRNEFYVSITRYTGNGLRAIVTNSCALSLLDALKAVTKEFLRLTDKVATKRDRLKTLVG